MGTEISLDIAGLSVDWSKNHRGADHGFLFQSDDRGRIPWDDDVHPVVERTGLFHKGLPVHGMLRGHHSFRRFHQDTGNDVQVCLLQVDWEADVAGAVQNLPRS